MDIEIKLPKCVNTPTNGRFYPFVYGEAGAMKVNACSQNMCKAMRRVIGLMLFKIRAGQNIGQQKIYEQLQIPFTMLDDVEIGKKQLNWDIIKRLMLHYNLAIKITFVERVKK